jgi:hypothetical protein
VDLNTVIAGFPNAVPFDRLSGAWHWYPAPGLDFVGVLSGDAERLLQVNAIDSFEADTAAAVLGFALEHEEEMFAVNSHLTHADGFQAPGLRRFDALAGVGPTVHDFYAVERPELTAHTRIFFPAYESEFSGRETLVEARARYDVLPVGLADRPPLPWVKMRYINTRTRSRSIGPDRGFTDPDILAMELREMDGGEDSLVEFEDRHGKVWRVRWSDGWWYADWTDQTGTPTEITLDDLLAFAHDRVHS